MKTHFQIFFILLLFSVTSNGQSTPGTPQGSGQPPAPNFGAKLGSQSGSLDHITSNPSNPSNPNDGTEGPTHHDRTIFWVHGLGATTDSWSDASIATAQGTGQQFPGRKVECVRQNMTYSEAGDILDAGLGLKQAINNYMAGAPSHGTSSENNFIIAHSQGGVVSRAMFHRLYCMGENQGEPFGANGLVTFGTPNQGARLLNNKEDMLETLDDICRDVASSYAHYLLLKKRQTLVPIWYFSKRIEIDLSAFIDPGDLTDVVCDFLDENIYGLISDEMATPITDSYTVPDPNDPNNQSLIDVIGTGCESQILNDMHKMAFYGVENRDGLFFRMLKYLVEDPNASDFFGANPDQDYVEFAEDEIQLYEERKAEIGRWLNEEMQRALEFSCGHWPWSLTRKCKNIKKRIERLHEGYKKQEDAIRLMRNLDERWKTIIGAAGYDIVSQGYCVCTDQITGEVTRTEVDSPLECDLNNGPINGNVVCEFEYVYERHKWEKDSDGVVLAESAMDMPSNTWIPQRMDITSHMQMRNNVELRDKLKKLYDAGYDPWFECLVK